MARLYKTFRRELRNAMGTSVQEQFDSLCNRVDALIKQLDDHDEYMHIWRATGVEPTSTPLKVNLQAQILKNEYAAALTRIVQNLQQYEVRHG